MSSRCMRLDLFIHDEDLFINHDDEFTDDATSAKGVESLDDAGFCEWKRFGDSRGDSPGDVFSGEVSELSLASAKVNPTETI
jgi:hypothetical protein